MEFKHLYRFLYNRLAVPAMKVGLGMALPFNWKVKEGARGRRDVIARAGEWRGKNPGSLVVIHSSSAGEYEASIPLINALKKRKIFTAATIFSPSGYRIAEKKSDPDFLSYLPFDSRKQIRQFLMTLKPDAFVFCKHDIWPNVVWECADMGIPTVLINTNLHPRSSRLNRLVRAFNRSLFREFSAIWTVTEDHARRIRKILQSEDGVEVLGDTRFDRVVSRALESELELPIGFSESPVFIAGSVWPVERFVLDTFLEIRRDNPAWRLIWVPHEPHESNLSSVENTLDKAEVSHIRFSQIEGVVDTNALLVDKVGILPPMYRFAEIAYVGGGFGRGVHSVIEPAAFAMPVIFGPAHHVSAEAGELIERGGGFSVNGREEFFNLLKSLMEDEAKRKNAGKIAGDMVREKTGVAEIEADKLMEIINKTAASGEKA